MNFSRRKSRLNSGNNVFKILTNTSLHGESSKSSFQKTHQILKSLEVYKVVHLNSLFKTVKKVEEALKHWKPDKGLALKVFYSLNNEIQEVAKRDLDTKKLCRNTEIAKWIRDLILEHTVEVLQKFIGSYTLLPKNSALHSESGEILVMKGISLEILHTICVEFEELAKKCASSNSFVHCLFSYMQYDETCFPACRVLECLMLSKKNVFDLSSIENLQEIIVGLGDIQLGNFCKILAITLSELDMYENKHSLYAQTKQKKNQNFYVRDVNQDIILRVPNILSRLVNVACAKPYIPSFPSQFIESEQWLRWIQEQVTHAIRKEDENVYEGFVGGITQWADNSCRGPSKSSIMMTLELTFRADAVCVLGLLLVGRHRKEVQKELADLKLIPQLSDLFDHFIWRANTGREYARLPGHNSSCECSPEVALKIQVLRLIHSFCDHSDYKHVMLSWSEYSEIRALEETSDTDVPSWLNRSVMCVGIKGLLSKIVEVIKKETGASTFRFWLSRAIESYLRGSFSSADQDFLLRRNLLTHVTQNLIQSNIRHKEVLQSSFDLLGELVKFNIAAFEELNAPVFSEAKQKKLVSLMKSSLVDSNMFIRSLILSYEQFVSSGDEDLKNFAEEYCYVLYHVGSLKTRVTYLQKLLTLINVENLTQENVSCLNTALVILMFGLKKGELPQYLHVLASNQESCSVATNHGAVHLDNLRDLLLFWQDHYLQKDKDCTILEKSSRICFQEWRDAVSLLTSDDYKNPCAIAFYTVPAVSSRAS